MCVFVCVYVYIYINNMQVLLQVLVSLTQYT